MDLYRVYAEPCPHCGTTVEPCDIIRVRDGYNCHYLCTNCTGSWEASFWANPRQFRWREEL